MVILKEITLKNFKSFKGETNIMSVPPFTAIVGCNGAGKSNFMDAICFAMGLNTSNLRVSRMEELVHRSGFGEYQHDMSVMVVVQSADGVETCFKRSIADSSRQHRINGNIVSYNDYVETLRRLGINARIKNFLVFQNSIETIVTKSPVERAAIFEDISGSGSLAAEYRRLKSRIQAFTQELQYLQKNKRSLSVEIKVMLNSEEKAYEYRVLEKKYDTAQVDLTLFNLYYIERNIRQWSKTVKNTTAKILALDIEKYAAEEKLKSATKACKKHKDKATLIKSHKHAMGMELLEKENDLTKAETNVQYAHSRVTSCQTSLESAKKADEARKESIKQLEDALKTVEQKKDEYCQQFVNTLGRDLQLRESQMEEYDHLKALCYERFVVDHQRLMILEREHKSIEDELECAMRRRNVTRSSLDRNSALRLECLKRAESIEEFVKETEHELETRRQYQGELLGLIESLKAKERTISKELADIRQQIGCCELREQIKEKNEIVNYLRRLYPGVLDRLRNMCNPIHDRYNVALTIVLGRQLDSIVVEASETARHCVEHLKDHHIGIETFLPLDDIKVEPLNQQLRNISNPPNVKLLYDVINFYPNIDRVIQFVTRNTLVCDIPEHAAEIAFAAQKKNRHDCVSVDGNFYRKSGLMSGGTRDLITEVQRWDSSQMALLSRKTELMTALREIRSGFPKESEISIVLSTVVNLETRLKYANNDYEAASRETSAIEFEIQNLEDDVDATMRTWEDVESRASESSKEIDELKLKINKKENEFFADFCKNVGVDDIRHYEEGPKLYNEAIHNFDCQIDRINEQLNFERAPNIEGNVSRREHNMREAERDLESHLKQVRDKQNSINEEMEQVYHCGIKYKSIKNSIKEESNKITEIRSKISAMLEEHSILSKQISGLETLIEKRKAHRHVILTEAKVRGLSIPLINGSPDDSVETSKALERSPSTNVSTDAYELESNTTYDFSKLSSNLTTLESRIEIRTAREKLEKSVADIAAAIEAIAYPNMKASQQVQLLKEKLTETKTRFERVSKDARKARVEFERVKRDRYSKFMEFFEHASEQVDLIYKKLTRSSSAQAYLIPENLEEPYLGGIHYNCIVPGKRFQLTSNLSGGEKTLAAIPLLFAAHSGDSPPFKVLDEIDTALDNKNTMKIMKYIYRNKNVQQSIVISHKKEFFGGADSLIGIDSVTTKDGTESRILTFDLRCYER